MNVPPTLYATWKPYLEPYLAFAGQILRSPVMTLRPGYGVSCIWRMVMPFLVSAMRQGPPPVVFPPWYAAIAP